ncbi:hypothetical protein N1851_019827 [Merluccius polli]|uniref:Uncharacterized protein n=1 Tax=Merluccius polli TaxID=89951 RepID=A0AA47NZ12_MERPO|nr:hypothetical protein N1851_019827 [Merluccius polli]
MFARPAAKTHFRGSDGLRGFAKACGAKCPKALTSTKLRKHAATLSTVLNMTDTEMDQLANFLGHDIRIHREFYRLPEKTLQLAKISKLLMALEQGRLAEFHGKNLDEITTGPDEEVLGNDEEDSSKEEGHCSSTVDGHVSPRQLQGSQNHQQRRLPPTEGNEIRKHARDTNRHQQRISEVGSELPSPSSSEQHSQPLDAARPVPAWQDCRKN